jgi:hypothetical protein
MLLLVIVLMLKTASDDYEHDQEHEREFVN